MWIFVFQKYDKYWGILLGHFIKHKPLISVEWVFTFLGNHASFNSNHFYKIFFQLSSNFMWSLELITTYINLWCTSDKTLTCLVHTHSSEIRGLCLMKWPSEMLQNLAYFWNVKTHFSFFIYCYFIFFLINALVGWSMSSAFIRGKNNVAHNEKKYVGFIFQKNGKFWSISLRSFHQA